MITTSTISLTCSPISWPAPRWTRFTLSSPGASRVQWTPSPSAPCRYPLRSVIVVFRLCDVDGSMIVQDRCQVLLAFRHGSSPDVPGRRSSPGGRAQGVPRLPRSGRGRGVGATDLPCRQEDLRRLRRDRRAALEPDLQTGQRRTAVAAGGRAVLLAALLRSERLAGARSRGRPGRLGGGSRARRCLVPPGCPETHAQGPGRVNRDLALPGP